MHMPVNLAEWTAEMVRALPDDGNRYEVVDGELLVSPAPRRLHQRALGLLHIRLFPYVNQHGIGELLMSPADIEFSPRDLLQPDLFVAPLVDGKLGQDWRDIRGLELAVEILSPSTARADRWTKRRRYQRANVPEYWIVDLDARMLERWRPADERGEQLTESLEWLPRVDVPPLKVDLVEFFESVNRHGMSE